MLVDTYAAYLERKSKRKRDLRTSRATISFSICSRASQASLNLSDPVDAENVLIQQKSLYFRCMDSPLDTPL